MLIYQNETPDEKAARHKAKRAAARALGIKKNGRTKRKTRAARNLNDRIRREKAEAEVQKLQKVLRNVVLENGRCAGAWQGFNPRLRVTLPLFTCSTLLSVTFVLHCMQTYSEPEPDPVPTKTPLGKAAKHKAKRDELKALRIAARRRLLLAHPRPGCRSSTPHRTPSVRVLPPDAASNLPGQGAEALRRLAHPRSGC